MQDSFQVLVACSANVCRSPLAASVIRSSVASLGSTVYVSWAGIYATDGDAMCPQAAAYVGHAGVIGSARQVTPPLLAGADLLLTADRSQRAWLARMDPSTRSRSFTLRQGARLATWVVRKLASGELPTGAPAMPMDPQARLHWLVSEMDAARGAHASWDPSDDDVEDLHGEEDHHQTLEAVARAASALGEAFLFVATTDPAQLSASAEAQATTFATGAWPSDEQGPSELPWYRRLLGPRLVGSAQQLKDCTQAEFLGQISSSNSSFSHELLTSHLEIEDHLQRTLVHAHLDTLTSLPAVVVITSAREGSGKTATAINIATSFAQSGRSVVLVDADLRASKVSAYLGIEPEVGLPDVVADAIALPDALLPWHRELIQVLPCGPRIPDPQSLLSSVRYRSLIEQLKGQFDLVVVNAPPLAQWPDSLWLSDSADGTVLVVARGRTSRRDASHCAELMRERKAALLGTIMTAAP